MKGREGRCMRRRDYREPIGSIREKRGKPARYIKCTVPTITRAMVAR